ncbi:response regulator transcription factor [Thermopolyspora sp. NPDC052614]|uniref:response regulator transcription factor n=1 Tax=Thermopolyspora sp. NPDC052614 TaxID=3155682 RepID=UPI00342F7E8F
MPRVVLADDHAFFREMLARSLCEEGIDVVAEAGDVPSLYEAVARHNPDVAVIDVRMPPGGTIDGLVAAVELRARRPHLATLVLSAHKETAHLSALLDGGRARSVGYLLKDRVSKVEEFAAAIRDVAAGKYVVDRDVVSAMVAARRSRITHLTPREVEVLALMAEGLSNAAIGERLHLQRGVEAHIRNIFIKLDLPEAPNYNRRVQAVLQYLQSPPR